VENADWNDIETCPDGDVDFKDLAVEAEKRLGPPGTPSANIAPQPYGDGTVNLLDFAENWKN